MNRATLIGNLGKDPETRMIDNDKQVSNFSVATTRSYKDKEGNKQSETTWHNIVVWNGLSKVADKYLKKGSKVMVTGEIVNRDYEDANKVKKYISEIVVREMEMLDKKPADQAPADANQAEKSEAQA